MHGKFITPAGVKLVAATVLTHTCTINDDQHKHAYIA